MAADVVTSFPNEPPFRAEVLEVITWFAIAGFERKYNTVQLVIAADAAGRSFVTVSELLRQNS